MKHIDLTPPQAQEKCDEISDVIGEDDGGVVAYGNTSSRDDIVTERWVHLAMADASRDAAAALDENDDKYAAEHLRLGAAMHAAFVELASNDRARAGDLLDVADLHTAGRGSICELVEAVARNSFGAAPRDEDERLDLGAMHCLEMAAEDAAKSAEVFSIYDAADVLERSLRCSARRLANRLSRGDLEFDRFKSEVADLRKALACAMAICALSRGGTKPVKAGDFGDCMEVYSARGGSISKIAADVLNGVYRDYVRDGDGEIMLDGHSPALKRHYEHWRASERGREGSRKAPDLRPT